MEFIILGLFALCLIGCVSFQLPILYALAVGFMLFFTYGLLKKFKMKQMFQFTWDGIRQVKSMLLIFFLIGMMTAVWRGAGTIPKIIDSTMGLLVPSLFIIVVFLLNCLVSVLTGTAFGTVATVGVISMTIANVMGENTLFVAGAILSGIYFGDRCSPMSTSALLICELTHMKLFDHIRQMIRTAWIPLVITVMIYVALGFIDQGHLADSSVSLLFSNHFSLSFWTLLPAIVIVLLLAARVSIKQTMLASIIVGSVICLFVQHMAVSEWLLTLWRGYVAPTDELGAMLNGGGILSMVKIIAIICLSSSYFGIFNGTKMLKQIEAQIEKLAHKTTNFVTSTLVSIVAVMISCNQTLAVMLTYQLNKGLYKDDQKTASMLADTAIVIPALIPWSIASVVPLTTVGAPIESILFACYLYLLPIVGIIRSIVNKRQLRMQQNALVH